MADAAIRIVGDSADDREHVEYDDVFGENVMRIYPEPNTQSIDPDHAYTPDGSIWIDLVGTDAIVLDANQVEHLIAYLRYVQERAQ